MTKHTPQHVTSLCVSASFQLHVTAGLAYGELEVSVAGVSISIHSADRQQQLAAAAGGRL
jgi:hypothetical protein